MVTVNYLGRISNNVIQHMVGHFIAEKYKCKFTQTSPIHNDSIKFSDCSEYNEGHNLIIVSDDNWLDIVLNDYEFDNPHFYLSGFFNERRFFESMENKIKENMTIEYNNEIDPHALMINYRIGELDGDRRMLPFEYYDEAIQKFKYSKGYITSDTLNHDFCQKIIEKYKLTPIELNPSDTISHCKDYNNLILSEGGFSWVIGFLSKTNNIICSGRIPIWHGELYFKRWKKLYWDYDPSTIVGTYNLTSYKPIKINKHD